MKLSYNWLKELTGCKLSPEKLAEILNLKVAAVENLKKLDKGLDKVVVAEILEIKKHPQADKLQLVKVTVDSKRKKIYHIVCGAFNIKVGDKVPLALPGAKLPIGLEIKEAVIRGIKSEGMLCAEDELGVGDDHTGILIFDRSVKLGEKVSKVLGLDDTIIEIDNTALTHRPDLFSHLGFAREISAITNSKFKIKNSKLKIKTKDLIKLEIKIENYNDCLRYMAVVIDGIKIEPSPIWLQNRLRNLGIRPINNIVDITNYVLLEIGQPLHAFDFEKISNAQIPNKSKIQNTKQIIIRRAKKEEKLLCLDGVERKLDEDILVIADAKKPIALAGIIGGEESGINEETKTIVIESANFNPVVVRKGARKLGLRTEASLRFEKGLPLIFPEEGIYYAIKLIEKIAGGKVVSKIYDVKSKKAEKELKTKKIVNLEIEKVSYLIGEKISPEKIIKYLNSLGFSIKKINGFLKVNTPLFRKDIEYPEDLVEEIARLYGYQKIKPEPIKGEIKVIPLDYLLKIEKELKNFLVGYGFDEIYNYSFYGERIIELLKLKKEEHLEIVNPLNPDQQYLRISLIPKLLENSAKNFSFFEKFRIFEIGKVYRSLNEKIDQPKFLAGLILEKNKKIFFTLKGVIETILEKIGIENDKILYKFEEDKNYQYLDYLTGIYIENQLIGHFGLVNEAVKNDFKIFSDVGVFEINLEKLKDLKISPKIYQKISPYPPIFRDLAFIVPKKITFDEIYKTIKNFHPLIYFVEPFDVFESEKLGKDVRNIAFHLTFQSFERTLKSEEVDKIINDLVKKLETKFNAKLRTF